MKKLILKSELENILKNKEAVPTSGEDNIPDRECEEMIGHFKNPSDTEIYHYWMEAGFTRKNTLFTGDQLQLACNRLGLGLYPSEIKDAYILCSKRKYDNPGLSEAFALFAKMGQEDRYEGHIKLYNMTYCSELPLKPVKTSIIDNPKVTALFSAVLVGSVLVYAIIASFLS